ncbi:hypothetical protein HanPSC8_Chr06g0246291 [Helianthus annuus]|nr:hypothetical protein HanPSC8_Chr06g0246291 [Helianthus annuus]
MAHDSVRSNSRFEFGLHRKQASQPGSVESTRLNRVNSVRVQVKQSTAGQVVNGSVNGTDGSGQLMKRVRSTRSNLVNSLSQLGQLSRSTQLTRSTQSTSSAFDTRC